MTPEYIAEMREKFAQERASLEEQFAKGIITRRDLNKEIKRIEEVLGNLGRRAAELLKKIEDVVAEYC